MKNLNKLKKRKVETPKRQMTFRELEKLSDLHYLNLNLNSLEDLKDYPNPLLNRSKDDYLHPEKEILRFMRNPDYFWFTCKYVLNIDLLPFQALVLKKLYTHNFPMLIGCRGFSKTFLLAVYTILVMLVKPGSKVALIGSGFRQSKLIFEYIEKIWLNAPVLQDMASNSVRKSGTKKEADKWSFVFGDSIAYALPVGNDGSRIRGLRATHLICDEFASQNPHIYENVIAGFANVSANPVRNVQEKAKIEFFKRQGLWTEQQEKNYLKNKQRNQTILSGTAFYATNHFCHYFERYRAIINSRGDKEKLREIFKNDVSSNFNWEDYCIIRVPYDKLPADFMDADQIERARAMISHHLFAMENLCIFSRDSDGFFKRTLIESCVTNDPVETLDGGVQFTAMLKGRPGYKYIYGIDPAAEKDNFSIVILEIHPHHRRVVYCWTINKRTWKDQQLFKKSDENDYFQYCCRKIRDLMKKFPTDHIVIDSQGGGNQIVEALHDKDKLKDGEEMLWPLLSTHPHGDKRHKDLDNMKGRHIIEMYHASNYELNNGANHGMKKDFEDKVLLFPYFDSISVQLEYELLQLDKLTELEETLDSCLGEIEEMKTELTTIEISITATGKESFDTPGIKLEGDKKGRLKKDRYSALLMANSAARRLVRDYQPEFTLVHGGFAGLENTGRNFQKKDEMMVSLPAWFDESSFNAFINVNL